MRRIILLFLLALSGFASLNAQYPTDSAKVYLITASPGQQTYAVFGHSALRVSDKSQNYDVVFNYGTFDFRTENFYLKFGTGKLMYFLSTEYFTDFLYKYQINGQAIYLQELNLTNKEKFELINNLEINTREENMYFRYDFCRDNCATRIRDIVEKSVDGKIVYDTTYAPKRESFRRLFDHYLQYDPWIKFGLNMIMGKSTDSIASINDYMYLPEHLQNLYASAKIVSGDSTRILASQPVELFPSMIKFKETGFILSPFFICMLIFIAILLITFWEHRIKRYFKWLDFILLLLTGLLGLMITWLWGWSLHVYLEDNLHIIWASPLNIIAAFCLVIFSQKRWLGIYFLAYSSLILLLIPVSIFITQEFNPASYFLMGMMLVRGFMIYKRSRKS